MITSLNEFKKYINENSPYEIGHIAKIIRVEIDLQHTTHSLDRKTRDAANYISDEDITATVSLASEQIIELLINDTINIEDTVIITNKRTKLNVVGILKKTAQHDTIKMTVKTVMIKDNFFSKDGYRIYVS